MWELRGCPYCRETHLVNFARADIEDYVKANFDILQLNIIGSRKVTDFDGSEISEKALAAKYGVRFTPTFQFFPECAARPWREGAGQARGRARARLSAAGRFPRAVPLRAREGLRDRRVFASMCGRHEGDCSASCPRKRASEHFGQNLGPRFRAADERQRSYFPVFTGLSRLISSATMSLICSTVKILFAPKRGMVEQANAALEL